MKAIFKLPYLHKYQTLHDFLRALDMPFEDELQHDIIEFDLAAMDYISALEQVWSHSATAV
ncbi:hypothetical protein T11_15175 [Trichinella zimbabwensis]|uniref:Uncharacterized protein n=1 Tax=Trichinella zimbabwensis TaxID=268475 RepID=A0A0V1HER1_9BILA|nr:hypothetical protein T11_15175 [Trichinella zimbabwensis]